MAGIFKAYDIRGTYPDQLDETTAFRIGYHFRDLLDAEDLALGPVVVVSRDMRTHSVPLSRALKDGLRARGVAVIDIGVADTPQNYFATGFLGASGGIQVTASHNPAEYNGFKMSRRDAIPVSYETGIDRLEELVLASEVIVDRGYITVSCLGQISHAGPVKSLLAEQLFGCVQQPVCSSVRTIAVFGLKIHLFESHDSLLKQSFQTKV